MTSVAEAPVLTKEQLALQFKNLADRVELELSKIPQADLQLKHTFCNGIYLREVTMPAGCMTASKIHKTRHPFIVLTGLIDVRTVDGIVLYIAPYHGITEAGTRRLLFAREDCWFMTVHANPWGHTTVEQMEAELVEDYQNPLFLS